MFSFRHDPTRRGANSMLAGLLNRLSRKNPDLPGLAGPGFGALCTALFIIFPALASSDDYFILEDICGEDAGGVGSCTANEILIASVEEEPVTQAEFCIEGDLVDIRKLVVTYGLNTGVRYDPLLWVGRTGNDPRDSGGTCYVSSIPPQEQDDVVFGNFEGENNDSCLDVTKPDPGTETVTYPEPFSVECKDTDEDGQADFQAIVTWHQNTNFICGTGEGEDFGPGAPPKCDWSHISLDIDVFPPPSATLTLLKEVNNEGGGTAVDTDWTLAADGPVYVDGIEGDFLITMIKVPVGVYELSESGPGGYTASDWSCTGGSLSGDQLTLLADDAAVCTITNTFISDESLTITKVIDSDDGGSATLDDFDVSVDAVEVDWADPNSTTGGTEQVETEAGTYTLSEVDVNGYTEGVWSCMDDEGEVPVSNGGAFDGADVTVEPGQHVSCSITNSDVAPQLTVIKHVVNDGGGTAVAGEWTMDVTADNPSSNQFPGAEAPGTTITIDAGDYGVDESGGPGGYDKSLDAGCSGTLDVGESATCTITNTFISDESLTITKVIDSDDGGSATLDDFDVSVDAVEVDWTDPDSTTGGTEQMETEAGTYTLSEADVNGYTEGVWSCMDDQGEVPVSNGGAFDGADVTVEPGQHVSCSITNSDVAPQLTVIKHVVNDGGGTAVAGEWTMDVTADNPSSNHFPGAEAPGTTITIDAGDYGVDESGGPGGYDKSLDAGCSGTLDVGESATCTITNTNTIISDESLTITKVIDSDDGGSATLDDFDVSVDAVEVDWTNPDSTTGGTEQVETEAGTYTLSEADVNGYTEGVWSCMDDQGEVPVSNGGAFDGADVTVEPGQHVSCSITNSDVAPQLTVIKHVVNDGGGTAVAGEWTMDVTADNPGSNHFPGVEAPGTTITIDAGDYGVDESGGPGGYDKSLDAGCSGTLDVGESATCTITNTNTIISDESLTITKVIDSDDGGSATLDDFDVSVDAVEVDWTDPDSTTGGTEQVETEAGTYTLSEADVNGYTEGVWSCMDDQGEVPVSNGGAFDGADVTVEPGQHVSCSITNSDVAPQLTVIKHVVNDGDGTAVAGEWTMDVTADNPGSNHFPGAEAPGTTITIDAGDYGVDESGGPGGYEDKSLDAGCSGTLDVGESATCTITNTNTIISDESLTITKVIDSDDGGSATLDDFDVSVDAVEVDWTDPDSTTGGTEQVETEAGTYTCPRPMSTGRLPIRAPGRACDDDGGVPVSNDGVCSRRRRGRSNRVSTSSAASPIPSIRPQPSRA